jgi:hypothetical protein
LRILCEQASIEQDPDNLADLVREINDLLEARQKRVREKLFADAKIRATHSTPQNKNAPAEEG